MPDGCVKDFRLKASDHKSKNGSSEGKSPRVDDQGYCTALSAGAFFLKRFNASTEDSLFDGNA
jgi:hypothetical protein